MKVLVTGGGGFLGSAIIKKLIERNYEVYSLNRNRYNELEKLGVTSIVADLSDTKKVYDACLGMDAVFHVGAKAGYWGNYEDYYNTNVIGTKNIIEGCIKHNVKKLIYTSSPSVAYNIEEAINIDESTPYPKKYYCYYSQTKALAEQLVLSANKINGLMVVALRPHLIFGPGDNHLIPRIINAAKNKKLKIVGNGLNKVDVTYIDNAAMAHINAFDRLEPNSPVCGSKYFISQGEPVVLWDFINQILEGVGIPKITSKVSYFSAYCIGATLEIIYSIFKIKSEPKMTRFLAAQLAHNHYFNISRAKNELGYEPKISTNEGLQKLISYLKQNLKNEDLNK